MGSSLKVQPVASLACVVPPASPAILINREVVGLPSTQFDVELLGNCDSVVRALCEKLHWDLPARGSEDNRSPFSANSALLPATTRLSSPSSSSASPSPSPTPPLLDQVVRVGRQTTVFVAPNRYLFEGHDTSDSSIRVPTSERMSYLEQSGMIPFGHDDDDDDEDSSGESDGGMAAALAARARMLDGGDHDEDDQQPPSAAGQSEDVMLSRDLRGVLADLSNLP